MKRLAAVLATAMLAIGWPMPSEAREMLYVQTGDDLRVIDAHTFAPVATISVGDHTDDVVGSRDGRMAYANAAISSGNPLGISDVGRVVAIDTATNKIVWSRALDGHPQHLTVSRDGARLYAPALNSNYVSVFDTATGQIVERWFATPGHHGTELSPDGKHLYVGNVYTGLIYVYDTDSGKIARTYDAGTAVRPFKIDAAEKRIYYQLSSLHGFEVRDLDSGRVTNVIDFPLPAKIEASNKTFSHGMAISPDGRSLVAVGTISKFVRVYSLPDLKLLGTVPVGDDANWVRIRADGKVAFVSNRGSGTISAIDIAGLKEITRIPGGSHPGRFDIVDVPEPPRPATTR